MWILLAFILVPLIEIGLFIQIGGWLGLWPTLAIVIITALAGTYLVRSQGLRVLHDIQTSLQNVKNPTGPLAHGAMILFSGALLLTPGFFTDGVGFLLLMPPVRRHLIQTVQKRIRQQQNMQATQDTIIETTYYENQPKDDTSPWAKD
ncbi:MAG: FxsA family protein [Pseudomonadota bacterium]